MAFSLTANDRPRTLLLIDQEPSDVKAIREALDLLDTEFELAAVRTLSAGLERLRNQPFAAVLIELVGAGGGALQAITDLRAIAADVPILVLSAAGDEAQAREAVHHGAQDYLLTSHLNTDSLSRALRHLIERESLEAPLFLERERAEVTLNSIGDAVLSTDLSGHVIYLNAVAERMTGWERADAVGRPLAEVFCIVDGTTRAPAPNPLAMAIERDKTVGLIPNCVLIGKDGHEAAIEDSAAPIHDRHGRLTGAVIVFHDVTAARTMALQLSHLAHHDVLTALPNRLLLNDRLARAMASARRHTRRLAVLYVDVDHFKQINDSLGHAIGDQLLRSVAERVKGCVRNADTVSRLGGDEFVILLSEVTNAEDVSACATKILAAMAAPHRIADHELHITASVGISVYPDHGDDPDSLIRAADMAMYHAKNQGRDGYQVFQHAMKVHASQGPSLEADLQGALDRREFVVHYQPKLNLSTGAIVGAEALIRWQHPVRGLVPPDLFIPIAEEGGLMVPIGRWVLREACREARAWKDAGVPPTPVSVNVSAVELRKTDFVARVAATLMETGLSSRWLELELTERAIMGHAVIPVLRSLKALGVQLVVDDFGTGYSSVSHLRRFPIDALKVDKSFVREITSGGEGAAIVSAVITMGKSLHQRIIAEGVETREQLAFLQAQRCGEGQGYYFSPPLAAATFADLAVRGLSAR